MARYLILLWTRMLMAVNVSNGGPVTFLFNEERRETAELKATVLLLKRAGGRNQERHATSEPSSSSPEEG